MSALDELIEAARRWAERLADERPVELTEEEFDLVAAVDHYNAEKKAAA